jgi:hypothetical protein
VYHYTTPNHGPGAANSDDGFLDFDLESEKANQETSTTLTDGQNFDFQHTTMGEQEYMRLTKEFNMKMTSAKNYSDENFWLALLDLQSKYKHVVLKGSDYL